MFVNVNPNPARKLVGDCVIRAISLAENQEWDKTFLDLSSLAYNAKDMPSSNNLWAQYLFQKGYHRYMIPDTCPDCYSIKEFCLDYPNGIYIVATGTHVVCVKDGDYLDTWDSGNEIPFYYFRKE